MVLCDLPRYTAHVCGKKQVKVQSHCLFLFAAKRVTQSRWSFVSTSPLTSPTIWRSWTRWEWKTEFPSVLRWGCWEATVPRKAHWRWQPAVPLRCVMFGPVTVSSLCYLPKCFVWVIARKFEMWGVGYGRTGKKTTAGAKREQRRWFNKQEPCVPIVLELLKNPRQTWTFHPTWQRLLEFQRGWELTWNPWVWGDTWLRKHVKAGPRVPWLLCSPQLPQDMRVCNKV